MNLQFTTGIGWRPEIAYYIQKNKQLSFFEIIAENIELDLPIPKILKVMKENNQTIIPHSVSLSIGSREPPLRSSIQRLVKLADFFHPPFVSDHICFVRSNNLNSGHLLPIPFTDESLDICIKNVREIKRHLPVPLALENIASLFEWPNSEMDEPTFIAELIKKTNCLLLLDVSNILANSLNHNIDVTYYLETIPLQHVAYIHMAGGIIRDGVYHDTHRHPIMPQALNILKEVCSRIKPPGVMLERDGLFPSDLELDQELTKISQVIDTFR